MMEALMKRAGEIARARQAERVNALAGRLRSLFGESAVRIEEARVLVTGRGLIRRWLIDPSLRFISGAVR